VQIASEGALWGSVHAHGFLRQTVIVSDDAGQFAIGRHALCWAEPAKVPALRSSVGRQAEGHAERLVHKLDAFTALHRAAQDRVRALIWWFYADLKAYRAEPTVRRRGELRSRFDRIFQRRTGFATLDRLLEFAGSSPITNPRLRQKHTRSQGPFLRRHYPASSVVRPCPTPVQTGACQHR
jgi:hypothetical protein